MTIKRKWVNGDEQTTMEEAIEECLKPDEKPEPEPDKYAEPVSIKPQPKRDTDHHFWKQRLLTREKVLQDIVKASKPSQVRVFIELIVMIVLIYLMLRDMYFDGRLNFILEWLGISPVTPWVIKPERTALKKLLDIPIMLTIYAKVGTYYEIGRRLIKYGFNLTKVSDDIDREIRKQEWKRKIDE